MKRYLLGSLVLLCAPAFAQTWLYDAGPAVEPSVADKFATPQPSVEFTVTLPNGSMTKAVAASKGGGERAGTVHYPTDFGNASTQIGNYKWVARVNGMIAHSGTFAYKPSKAGRLLLVPY